MLLIWKMELSLAVSQVINLENGA